MEILAVVFIVGALWTAYKVGTDAGRNALLDAQSRSIDSSLTSDSEFLKKTGLHGSFFLDGHEYRSSTDYVIVKFSDLDNLLKRSFEPCKEEQDLGREIGDREDASEAISEKTFSPSESLSRLVGADLITRAEVTKIVWKYIEDHQLQDSDSPTQINCDPILIAITGEEKCSFFRLTKLLNDSLR
jgi:chromatin remodeling complex protein RSC6